MSVTASRNTQGHRGLSHCNKDTGLQRTKNQKGTEPRLFLQGAGRILSSRAGWSNCPLVLKGAGRKG